MSYNNQIKHTKIGRISSTGKINLGNTVNVNPMFTRKSASPSFLLGDAQTNVKVAKNLFIDCDGVDRGRRMN